MSLASAVLALLVYKRVSNQEGIERVKRRMQASLFEIRLFNDDLRAILRAQGGFLLGNLRYLGLNLKPLLWLLVPFVLVFVHLEPRFRYDALTPDATTIVKASVTAAGEETGVKPDVKLRAPDGLRLTSPAVWSAGQPPKRLPSMAWRVTADRPGAYQVTVTVGGVEHAKEIRFGGRTALFSPQRPGGGFLDQLAHPAERPLPHDGGLAVIEIDYPERDWGKLPLTDVRFAWWFWWLVLMVGFGLLLRKPMGVQI